MGTSYSLWCLGLIHVAFIAPREVSRVSMDICFNNSRRTRARHSSRGAVKATWAESNARAGTETRWFRKSTDDPGFTDPTDKTSLMCGDSC